MNRFTMAVKLGMLGLLDRHLPARTKRLIFLASLSARLKGSTSFTRDTVHRLNTVMALASDEASINLPVQLSRVIWHTPPVMQFDAQELGAILTQDRLHHLCEEIQQRMPAWLRYSDERSIRHDVEKLLTNRTAVFGFAL